MGNIIIYLTKEEFIGFFNLPKEQQIKLKENFKKEVNKVINNGNR